MVGTSTVRSTPERRDDRGLELPEPIGLHVARVMGVRQDDPVAGDPRVRGPGFAQLDGAVGVQRETEPGLVDGDDGVRGWVPCIHHRP